MSPEIQRMSPERMSREIQWTEPRVPEEYLKFIMESSDCGGYDEELGRRRSFDMQDVGQTSLVCTGKD